MQFFRLLERLHEGINLTNQAYEEIQPEMNVIRAMIEARTSQNLTQKPVGSKRPGNSPVESFQRRTGGSPGRVRPIKFACRITPANFIVATLHRRDCSLKFDLSSDKTPATGSCQSFAHFDYNALRFFNFGAILRSFTDLQLSFCSDNPPGA